MSQLLFQIKDLKLLLHSPRTYGGRRTVGVRSLFHKVFAYSQYSKYQDRCKMAADLTTNKTFTKLPEETGILRADFLDRALVDSVVQEARNTIKNSDLQALKEKARSPHLVSIKVADSIGPDSIFVKFALHEPLALLLADYFKMIPVIENIFILYSPNEANLNNTSQLYHLDGQDVRTVQVFMNVEDVDEDTGPLTLVNADVSMKIAKEINYRKTEATKRIPDELVNSYLERPDQVYRAVGKAGTTHIVDTDRCFHYGSRQASKPRYLIVFQYITPFAFTLPRDFAKSLPLARFGSLPQFNNLEKRLLGAV